MYFFKNANVFLKVGKIAENCDNYFHNVHPRYFNLITWLQDTSLLSRVYICRHLSRTKEKLFCTKPLSTAIDRYRSKCTIRLATPLRHLTTILLLICKIKEMREKVEPSIYLRMINWHLFIEKTVRCLMVLQVYLVVHLLRQRSMLQQPNRYQTRNENLYVYVLPT
jgi:hypothetical protein